MNNNLSKGSPSLGRSARVENASAQEDVLGAANDGVILVATDTLNSLFDMLEHVSSLDSGLHPAWLAGMGNDPHC